MKQIKTALVWLMCLTMVVTMLPASVTAAEDDGDYSISNDYLIYTFNEDTGGFSIDTLEGHPQKYYDNNIPLLYKEDKERSNGTSFISVRIDDKDYIFGQDYSFFKLDSNLEEPVISEEGRLITIEWSIKDITVIKKVALSADADSDTTGNAGISFEVINNGTESHDVGIRLLLDTALGTKIDSPYVIVDQNISPTYVETEYSGDSVPSQIRNVDALSNPKTMSYLITKGWTGGIEPTKITVGHWANLANTKYDYTADRYCDFTNYSNKYGTPDSAMAVYWEPGSLAAGASFTAETLYGVGNFSENSDDATVGLNMTVDRVELSDDGTSYANDGIVNVSVDIDNTYDNSERIPAAVLNLSFDEDEYEAVGQTQISYEDMGKNITTATFQLKAKPQAEICAGEIVASFSGTRGDELIEAMAERSVILPSVEGIIPDIQMTSVRPGIIYYEGTKAVTVTGDMAAFDVLAVNDGWDLRLYHTTTDHTVLIEKKNISFLNKEYTSMAFSTDEDLVVGEYEIQFDFTDEQLVAAFGKSIKASVTVEVSADSYYKLKSYGIVALVRSMDGNDATYDFFIFADEAEYWSFYDGEEQFTGSLNNTVIKYDFGENVESILEHEILVTARGDFREMQRETNTGSTEVYWQANTSDSDVIINNMLSYEGDTPLKMYRDDDGYYKVEGDGLLKVVNSITVWRNEWSIYTFDGIIYSLEPERASDLAGNVYQVELSLDGVGTMVQSLGGFLIDLQYGVLNSEWWDDSVDGRLTYGIDFGGMAAIPIADDKSSEESHSSSGSGTTSSSTSTSTSSSGKLRRKSTGLTDGQVTAEISSVMFGENGGLDDDKNVVVEDIGFKGIDTTVSLGMPKNAFGSLLSNGAGVAVTMTINTIDNIYEFDLGISVKVFECEILVGFKEASIDGKATVLPNNLAFYIRNGLAIPLGPPATPVYITGLGGGIYDLADTIGGNYIDKLPPITINAYMRLQIIKLLVGDFNVWLSLDGLQLTGELTINDRKEILDINAGLSARWLDPWSINAYGNISVLDGIVQGGLTVTIAEDYFYGYVYAAIYVPDTIPFVGGAKLAGVEAAASHKFIGANVEIIGFKFGVIYYWGEGVSFGDNIDLSAPEQAAMLSINSSDAYSEYDEATNTTTYYGTNVHKLQATRVNKGLSIMSLADYQEVTTSVDTTGADNLLFAIKYTGDSAPKYDELVLVNPNNEEIEMELSDGAGGGNFFTKTEDDGEYIYISVTDKSLITSGNWTLQYSCSITPGTISVSAVDDVAEITGVSASYDSSDPYKLDTSWTLSSDVSDGASLDIYLTEDPDIVEKIKTDDNTESGLGDNMIHIDDVSTIQSGSAEIEIPESYISGTYYAVAMLSTMQGANCVISANSFDFVNPNSPMDVADVTVSYGGNGRLKVDITDPDNADYTDYLVEVVSADGTVLSNNINQYDIDDDDIYIGGEAGLSAGQDYYVNVRTLREETVTPDVGSTDTETRKYYYGTDITCSNTITMPATNKPTLLSVEATFDTSKENITEQNAVITYTFDQPVWLQFNLRGQNYYYDEEYLTVWEVELDDLEDGDYYTDFTATNEAGDYITGAECEDTIDDARIGFTIDSSEPILSLSQVSADSLDGSSTAVYGSNVVFTDANGNYTISGITEVSSELTVDGSADDLTIEANGAFTYTGKLASTQTDTTHVLQSVDKAGNISELVVYVVNSNVAAIDSIILYDENGEPFKTNDYNESCIFLDEGQSAAFTVKAHTTNDEYLDIPIDSIEWSLLGGLNVAALNSGTVTALAGGETAVKAKLPTAVITTEDGEEITVGFETYVIVTVSEVFSGYILSYNANGGSGAPSSVTGLEAGDVALNSTTIPTHAAVDGTAVEFIGWSTSQYSTIYSKAETVPDTVTSVTISANTTVYAVWGYDTDGNGIADALEDTYTIYYDANGGTGAPDSETELLAGEYTLNTTIIPTYTTEGTPIVFIGWSLTQDSEIYAADGTLPTTAALVVVSADTTVYAVWGYDTDGDGIADILQGAHSISYELTNVDSETTSAYVVANNPYSTVLKAHSGYTLANVTVTMGGEDITAEVYDGAGTITIAAVTGDVVITATAELTKYTLYYDANGGVSDSVPAAQTNLVAGEYTLDIATVPTHAAVDDTAVVFIGWSETADGTIYAKAQTPPDTVTSVSIAADTTVYAVWGYDTDENGTADVLQETYTITYNANNGENAPAAETDLLAGEYTLSTAAPTHAAAEDGTAIVFIGWSTTQDSIIYAVSNELPTVLAGIAVTADTTVYAVWGYDTDGDGVADIIEGAYKITYDTSNIIVDVETEYVLANEKLALTVKAADGHTIKSITVTMDGKDVTDEVYNAETGEIVIESVTGEVIITAAAAVSSYAVTYALENITSSNTAATAAYGSVYNTVLTAADGYVTANVTVTMGGADITAEAYDTATGAVTIANVTGNIVITASAVEAAANTYTVAYTLDNVTSSNTALIAEENSVYETTLTAADGYTLTGVTVTMGGADITAGAYDAATGIVTIADVTGDIAITAAAQAAAANTYTVALVLENITSSNTATTVTEGAGFTTTLTPADGYSLGDVTVTMGGEDITASAYDAATGTITITAVTGDIAVTVTAAVNTYTLTYSANGGSGTMTDANSPYVYGTAVTALANKFTRSSYTFSGWNTAADGSGTSIAAGDEFTITADTTLYAQWKSSSSGSSGGGSSSSTSGGSVKYTVTFETNGGSDIDAVSVSKNSTVSEPTEPTKDGYEFAGWYSDEELTSEYDFGTKVTKSITLYAKWTKTDTTQSGGDTHECPSEKFTDVDTSLWYHEYIDYVLESELMKGTGDTTFEPTISTTRGMIVTMLYRMEGEPEVTEMSGFDDVADSEYYADAVAWASANGIVEGYGDGTFGPNDSITREQMAAIIYRYMTYKGMVDDTDYSVSYSDYSDISDYAKTAVTYCTGEGILTGNTDGTFLPLNNATRAETAAVFTRVHKAITE